MNLLLLAILLLLAVSWTCQASLEPFLDAQPKWLGRLPTDGTMRPWFGYEPGYGPGWNRKGCCDVPVPFNMGNS